jgi:5-methylcytosine-specific restriction endonuclease McrA
MEARLKQQHFSCFYCGEKIDMTGHLDHMVPIYRGGGNYLRNLVAACKRCNLTKGTDIIEITNPYTIKDYTNLITAKEKYIKKTKRQGC